MTLDVQHNILIGFATVVFGGKEFGYLPFHGWLFDPRVFLGTGSFISDSTKLAEMVFKLHRKLPSLI